jgi:beta-glucuronidase
MLVESFGLRAVRPIAYVCLFLILLTGGAAAQSAPPALFASHERESVSLDGEWAYIIDAVDIGATTILGTPKDDGYFRDLSAAGPADLLEYDFDAAPTMTVPGSWSLHDETLFRYEDVVWLRRRFDAEPEAGRRYFLQFDAVNYAADVYLNGALLGSHEGGFTPFEFEVTDALQAGTNRLVVKVEAERRAERVPAERMDWWNYPGITRSVRLVETGAVTVRGFEARLNDLESRTITGFVELDADAPASVTVSIPELGVSTTVEGRPGERVAYTLQPDCLELWSPERPRLYAVELSTGDERIIDTVGFRTIETRGRALFLNGRPIFLRGISLHDEIIGPDGGRVTTREEAGALLDAAEALNANFVRLAHYPHSEHMLREADRRGFLVWSELPVYWSIDFENPQTLAAAQAQYAEMIARDRNRASVIIWSVANETMRTEARLSFLSALIDSVREDDPSRLISAALLPDYSEASIAAFAGRVARRMAGEVVQDHSVVLDDPLGALTDIVALNQYYGWYYSRPIAEALGADVGEVRDAILAMLPSMSFTSVYDKPMMISEFGAGAVQGRRGPEDEIWTEDFQARYYGAQFGMLLNNLHLAGISPWVLKDFRSPMRPLDGVQDYWNRKGLISETGERKLAFDTLLFAYRALETSWQMRMPYQPNVCPAPEAIQ